MELEDIWEKVANNARLTREELSFLKQSARETQLRNSFVAGNTTAQNTLALNLPINVIYSQILHKDLADLTIDIPPDYNHLLMLCSAKTTHAAYNDGILGRFNSDDGANYSEGYDGGQASSTVTGQTKVQTYFGVAMATGTSATAGATGSSFLFIPHYNSSNWKSILSVRGTGEYSATDVLTLVNSAHWRNTSKVKTITMASGNSANLAAGSIFSIYGII